MGRTKVREWVSWVVLAIIGVVSLILFALLLAGNEWIHGKELEGDDP